MKAGAASVNRRAGCVLSTIMATTGLVGGFFHALPGDTHISADADEGVAGGEGESDSNGKRDVFERFHCKA